MQKTGHIRMRIHMEWRDIYNTATIYDATTGKLTHALPDGGLLNVAYNDSRNYSVRAKLTMIIHLQKFIKCLR